MKKRISFVLAAVCALMLVAASTHSAAAAEEEFKIAGASLALSESIAINYKVSGTLFTSGGYSDPYMIFSMNGRETRVDTYRVVDGNYMFDFKEIAPHEINDTVTSTLYATKDGGLCVSAPREYSVATYCNNMLARCTGSAYTNFRALLHSVLAYGDAAYAYVHSGESGGGRETLLVMYTDDHVVTDGDDRYYPAQAIVNGVAQEIRLAETHTLADGVLYTAPQADGKGFYTGGSVLSGDDTFTASGVTNDVTYNDGILSIAGRDFMVSSAKVNLVLVGGANNDLMSDAGKDCECTLDTTAKALAATMNADYYDYEYNVFALLAADGSEVVDTLYVFVYEAVEI